MIPEMTVDERKVKDGSEMLTLYVQKLNSCILKYIINPIFILLSFIFTYMYD